MADHGSGTLLVGYRRDDLQRRAFAQAWIYAGRCIGCHGEVFVNESGAAFLRERDADVACYVCEARYSADMIRSL